MSSRAKRGICPRELSLGGKDLSGQATRGPPPLECSAENSGSRFLVAAAPRNDIRTASRNDTRTARTRCEQKSPACAGLDFSPLVDYAWNDFPQPQPPLEFGLVTENPAPRKSST